MMRRYLLLIATAGEGLAERARSLSERTGLATIFATDRMAVLASSNCGCLPLGGGSVAIGTLFRRHDRARPVLELEDAELGALGAAPLESLIRRYWGGYVAATSAPLVRVLRDPSGAMPCYHAASASCRAFASDAALLVACGFAAGRVDWESLGSHFLNAGLPSPATSLSGIEELLPGFAIEVRARMADVFPCWSPWDHVRAADPETSAERVARAVRQSVEGWSAAHRRFLVSISGGLDSSIVAACLAASAADATCLTMFGEDPEGDERLYARPLCEQLGLSLVERQDRLEAIDIAAPLAPHLPRPFGRTHALSYEAAHVEVARQTGADAFMTGNGGDSVFGYSQSAAAIADRYRAHGLGAGVVRTAADVCRQTGCSMAQALGRAVRIARAPPAYRWRRDSLLLEPALAASLSSVPPDHPWLRAPPDALPGKAAHIASILRVQHCMEPGRSSVHPVLNPLMAQPVLEACLAVPSWEWREGGRDRAVARRAFAGIVPDLVLRRRGKGGPDAFAGQIVDRLRAAIRERLLGGHLAAHGVVDRAALEAALSGAGDAGATARVRILELLAAEAWLDHWSGGAARARGG